MECERTRIEHGSKAVPELWGENYLFQFVEQMTTVGTYVQSEVHIDMYSATTQVDAHTSGYQAQAQTLSLIHI